MQDRYAGDLGDFLTFGLLRWLVPSSGPLRLGVVWYRTLDEAHNADGKHIAYLQPGHRLPCAGWTRTCTSGWPAW